MKTSEFVQTILIFVINRSRHSTQCTAGSSCTICAQIRARVYIMYIHYQIEYLIYILVIV